MIVISLSHMMSAAMNGGFISGFSMGARSDDLVFVPHLFFAGDTLIFCGTTPDQF